jgi:putative addiction module component (TIGR02574 family)
MGARKKTMSDAVAQIVAQLNALSQEERAELACAVLSSLEQTDPDAEEAWNQELRGRVDRIQNGTTTGIPAEQVFADWRRQRQ